MPPVGAAPPARYALAPRRTADRAARDPRPYTGGSCTLRLRRSTNSATDWHQPAAAPPASTPACAAPCRWPPWPYPRDFLKRNPSQTVRDERFPEYRGLEEA